MKAIIITSINAFPVIVIAIMIALILTACHTTKAVAIKTKVPCQSKAGKEKKEYYNKLQYN